MGGVGWGTYWEYANGQKTYVYEKNVLSGLSVPARGYIHVYDHNIQTSSPLKRLGQSKPNFM